MAAQSLALRVSPTTTHPATVLEAIAEEMVEVLVSPKHVPRAQDVAQLRRSIECGKATPIHMLLKLSLEYADQPEIPIGHVTAAYEQITELLRERRRLKLEAMTGSTHAIAGPSLLRDIKREDRFEHDENQASCDVLADEDDPEALQRLLNASAAEAHEQVRRDNAVRERLARALMRETVTA